jgi:glycosyltransferase involved in cell wall biosynthesis/SAM-dependent methyltransferase
VRILHVIPWLAERYGGPAVLVPQAAVALIKRGHEVEIVTTNVDGPGVLAVSTGRLVQWAGAPTTFHRLSRPRSYVASWSLFSDLRRRVSTFDIVHLHYLYRFHGLAVGIAARSQGVPYVIQAHGSLDPWHRDQKRRAKNIYHAIVEDRIIGGAAVVLCSSEAEQSHIRGLGYRTPAEVIPNGIDAAELRTPGTPELLQSVGIGRQSRLVTFIGRISAKKGVPLLVESFRRTADSFPSAHLVVAGPDEEGIGRNLVATIHGTELARRVSFVGPVRGSVKRTLLQQSDVFVLASEDESFGIAVGEAMAVGCPVVVSPEVAISDVVRSSGAGIVAQRDPDAIASAIGAILGDPARATAMGNAGTLIVDEHFAWPVVAEQLESMYHGVIEVARSGRHRRSPLPSRAAEPSELAYACPRCRGALSSSGDAWHCETCAWESSSTAGVPVLLPDASIAVHDELDHSVAGHKLSQVAHFDRADHETFEMERPHGTPRLYRFLLDEKFRRAVSPIRPHLAGASALTVCGGSGMDAEYLTRAGATVISSDISLGAATRAMTRSKRFGLGIRSIVADVEHLPFPDQSLDLVAVHDGLHHLDDPFAGLGEMARVARRWVVISEPARATVTRLAVRLGLALEREEAGNRVARMEPSEVAAFLKERGFAVLHAERYAMYYPHHPGPVFRLLSRGPIHPIVRLAWQAANGLLGRFGNKMVVIAERVQPAEDITRGTAR